MTNPYLNIAIASYCVVLLTSGANCLTQAKVDDSNLRLIHVIFRHGDRTFDRQIGESYKNDPYKDYNTYPVGDGQLTNSGKVRAYKLGQELKKRYENFLGRIYYQPNIYARSTAIARCKMTLQLVLAGLYPPVSVQKWDPFLLWQPMDMLYAPIRQDGLLFPMLCPAYLQAYKNLIQSKEVETKIKEFDDVMEKISMYTGNNITNILDLSFVYSTLSAQSFMGLTLPAWTNNVLSSGELLRATILQCEINNYNDELIKFNGGRLLYRIISDMNSKINGTLPDRKINLFSAHDITIVAMLKALDIFDNKIPAYMSGVILELHEKKGEYYVKVLHHLGIPQQTVTVNIPGCDVLCPYEKFIQLTEARTGSDDDPTCPLNI